MNLAPLDWRRRKASISASLTMSSVPMPPGTQITSSCGQSAKVVVGLSVSAVSLATGSMRFQIRCTFAFGIRDTTCSGPVKSSWVTRGNNTNPICSWSAISRFSAGFECRASINASVCACHKRHISLKRGHQPSEDAAMIGVLIFPDFQLLDAAGPISVFEIAGRYAGKSPVIRAIAEQAGPVKSSSGVEMLAQKFPREALDTLIVAGGDGTRHAVRSDATLKFVRGQAKRARRIASVCSG